jgi:F-type H+-transporting ATPase subunit a
VTNLLVSLAEGTTEAAGAVEAAAEHHLFHMHEPQELFKGVLGLNNMIVTQWVIILGLILLGVAVNRLVIANKTSKLRTSLEMAVDGLEGWYAGFVGGRKNARKYLPLLMTLFLFILISNYSGILPTAGYLLFAPTGRWGTTLGLAVFVSIFIQIMTVKELGFGGWIKHLLHLGPLSILEEFIRPFSLSLRLFGNIFGEETLLAVIVFMVPFIAPIPIMGLSLLFGFIQALVFTTLTAIYIGSVLEHAQHVHGHDDDHAHEGGHEPAPAH